MYVDPCYDRGAPARRGCPVTVRPGFDQSALGWCARDSCRLRHLDRSSSPPTAAGKMRASPCLLCLTHMVACRATAASDTFPAVRTVRSVHTVRLDITKAVQTVDSRFVSFTLDSSGLPSGYAAFEMESLDVIALVSAIAPAYLRIGGGGDR
eukprot:SAG31_NODE_227_length_19818_cov_6.503271_2_plen_152_part_00